MAVRSSGVVFKAMRRNLETEEVAQRSKDTAGVSPATPRRRPRADVSTSGVPECQHLPFPGLHVRFLLPLVDFLLNSNFPT